MRLIPLALAACALAAPAQAQTPAQQQAQVIAAGQVVAQFHQMFNAGQYAAIWAGAAPNLQADGSQAQFVGIMTAYMARLGAYQSHVLVGDVVTDNSAGNFTTLTYTVTYAKGVVTESFVVQLVDGQPKIAYFSTKNVSPS